LKEEFRITPIQLLPVLGSLVFGVLCAYLLTSSFSAAPVLLFPEGTGSVANAVYFVVLAGAGATLIYFLLKRRKLRIISLITGFALTVAILMLSIVYLSVVFSLLDISSVPALLLTIIVSCVVTILADSAIFKVRGKIANFVILLLGGSLGAFLGTSIPVLSAILILAFLAAYDVYAVYRGAVGKIAQRGFDELQGLSFSFRDVQMGLGDLTFYSMLIGAVLANAGILYCLMSIVGVLAGVSIVLKMVEKRGLFPGLPFPVILGLVPLLIYLLA
jgi:presenilin-like A22 family membrane protease